MSRGGAPSAPRIRAVIRPDIHLLYVVALISTGFLCVPDYATADVALNMSDGGYGIGTASGELIVFVTTSLSGEDAVPGYRVQLFDTAVVGLCKTNPLYIAFSSTGEIVKFSSTQAYIDLEFRGGFGSITDEYQLPGLAAGDELLAVGQIGPESNEIFFGVTREGLGVRMTTATGAIVADWLGPIAEAPIGTEVESFGSLKGLYRAGDD